MDGPQQSLAGEREFFYRFIAGFPIESRPVYGDYILNVAKGQVLAGNSSDPGYSHATSALQLGRDSTDPLGGLDGSIGIASAASGGIQALYNLGAPFSINFSLPLTGPSFPRQGVVRAEFTSFTHLFGWADAPYFRAVLVTGSSATIPDNTEDYQIDPAGTLANAAVTMPANPYDGQRVAITSSQTITALTHNPNTGQTLLGALTTIAANGFAAWRWNASTATWHRRG